MDTYVYEVGDTVSVNFAAETDGQIRSVIFTYVDPVGHSYQVRADGAHSAGPATAQVKDTWISGRYELRYITVYDDKNYFTTYRRDGSAYTNPNGATGAPKSHAFDFAAHDITVGTVKGPIAPSGVTAVAGNSQATVGWVAPKNDGGSRITSYTVTASPGGATVTTTGALTAVLTGLTNGTTYTFTVTATNAIGNSPASTPSTPITPAVPGPAVSRASAIDRYGTSAAISASTFEPGVPVAYIANGSNFPDALSGAAAAGTRGGPVLLSTKTELPPATAAELDRLAPKKIVILGGTGVISDNVLNQARSYTGG